MASDRFLSWPVIDENVLPRIINQHVNGSSGSCSMVATTAACASIFSINSGHTPPDLASQELINYLPSSTFRNEIQSYDVRGCPSAFSSTSLKYIQHHGVGLATDMPFVGYPNGALIQQDGQRLYIDHYIALNHGSPLHVDNRGHDHFQRVPFGGGEVIPDLLAQHPIIGEFDLYPSFEWTQTQVYDNKILTDQDREYRRRQHIGTASRLAHAILIVGFGTSSDGVKYYVCQNSYGPEWGVYGGHVKIDRRSFVNYFYPVNPHFR